MPFRVGVDIGGTFTDIVFLDPEGRVHTKKVSSSVDDYARAIVDGVRELFAEILALVKRELARAQVDAAR
jgi:N-methylhydantoinase A